MAISPEQARQVFKQADCLFSKQQVDKAISDMAGAINHKLEGEVPLVLCVMNGGVVLTGILLPQLNMTVNLDYIHVTRYAEDTSGGELQWLVTPRVSLRDRVILVVDDIFDEGETIKAILHDCKKAGAREVYSAVLVNKVHDRKANVAVDFIGLEVDDRYVFGYGMDYKGFLRNAPGIYAETDRAET